MFETIEGLGINITNFIIVVIFVGALVWLIRKIVPAKTENAKWFKIMLRVGPVIFGAGISCIPSLRPIDDISKSILLGFVGGTFSQTSYIIIRSFMPEKIKAFMGGKK